VARQGGRPSLPGPAGAGQCARLLPDGLGEGFAGLSKACTIPAFQE